MNIELDPTRESIVAKLNGKKAATQKLHDSAEGLEGQIDIYDTAIKKTLEKLESQRSRKASFEASREQVLAQAEVRQGEVEHMEEILSRFDEATAEGNELSVYLTKRAEEYKAGIDWDTYVPGSTEPTELDLDEEYQTALARKRFILDLRETCRSDVNKIMVARGEVSGVNEKGRKGV